MTWGLQRTAIQKEVLTFACMRAACRQCLYERVILVGDFVWEDLGERREGNLYGRASGRVPFYYGGADCSRCVSVPDLKMRSEGAKPSSRQVRTRRRHRKKGDDPKESKWENGQPRLSGGIHTVGAGQTTGRFGWSPGSCLQCWDGQRTLSPLFDLPSLPPSRLFLSHQNKPQAARAGENQDCDHTHTHHTKAKK